MTERQIFLSLREFAKEEFEAKRAKRVEVLRIKKKGTLYYKIGPIEYIVISYFENSVRIYYFLQGGFLSGADTFSLKDFEKIKKLLEGKTKLLIRFEEKIEKPPTLPELSAKIHKEFLKILEKLKYLCNCKPRKVPVISLKKNLGKILIRNNEKVFLDVSLLEKPYETFLISEAFHLLLPEFIESREYWSKVLTVILTPDKCKHFPEYFPGISTSSYIGEEKIKNIFMFLNFLKRFEEHFNLKESGMLLQHVLAEDFNRDLYSEASKLYQKIYLSTKNAFWAFKAALFNLIAWNLTDALEIAQKYLNNVNDPTTKIFSEFITSSTNLTIKTVTKLLTKIRQNFSGKNKFLKLLSKSFEAVKNHVLELRMEVDKEYIVGEKTSIGVILENHAKDIPLKNVKVEFKDTIPRNSIRLLEDWSQGYYILEEIKPVERKVLVVPLVFLKNGKIKIRARAYANDSLNNDYKTDINKRVYVRASRK